MSQYTTLYAPLQSRTGSLTNTQRLAGILSDLNSHSMTSLTRSLNTSPRGVRARISELRTNNGFVISNSDGNVQLCYVLV